MHSQLVKARTTSSYSYEGSDGNNYLFTRGRAAYMYTHTPNRLGFVGNTAYWDETNRDGFTVTVNADGANQTLNEDASQRKQTPSYFTSLFQTGGKSLKIKEVKYITYNNVMVANLTVESTQDRDVTLTTASPFAAEGADGATELTGRVNVKNNLTTIYPRFSANNQDGSNWIVSGGKLTSTLSLKANEPQTVKIQLGLIANELPDSTKEYEARYTGDFKDAAASYKDSVTTYNKWWVDNAPYVDTPEDNIDKTVVYRWWLSRFNMLDATCWQHLPVPDLHRGCARLQQPDRAHLRHVHDGHQVVPQPRVLLRHLAFRRRYRQEEQGGLLLLPRQSGRPGQLEP